MSEEIIQQDANTPESSAPESTSPAVTQESAQESQSATPETQLPFHEHPRFKELINERKEQQARLEQYEQRIAEMEARHQREAQAREQTSKQPHEFVQKLKEINPAYGEWAGNVETLQEKVAKFEAWQAEQQREQVIQQYTNSVEKLHAENNVPKELQPLYKAQLDAMATNNPKLGLKDVPAAYKQIHEQFSKLLEGTKRAERKSYVVDKTKDASAPASQPKGKVPSTNKGPEKFQSKEEAYASIVKQTLNKTRAESDL